MTKPSSPQLTWAQRVRAEGRVHEMSWVEKLGYLVKYFAGHVLHADPATEANFHEQRRFQAYLRAIDEVTPSGGARVAFFGDLMWMRDSWETFLAPGVLAELRRHDALVGNLESAISPRAPVTEWLPDLIRYNARPGLVNSFSREDGTPLFGALGFANNHVLDLGDDVARDTLRFLASRGIPTSGVGEKKDARRWCEFACRGLRFGFHATSFGLNEKALEASTTLHLNRVPGLVPEREGNEPDLAEAERALREMEEAGVHVKIVFLHWGFEFEFHPTERMRHVARSLVRAGADFVVGSHPHVPHPMEVLCVNGWQERFPAEARAALSCLREEGGALVRGAPGGPRAACVLYSLGNFATAMYTFFCRVGLLAGTRFYRNSRGEVRWTVPDFRFLYNQPRPRRLDWLDAAGAARLGQAERYRFLEAHLHLTDASDLAFLARLPRPAP